MADRIYQFDLSAEVDRLFDESSVVESGDPRAVILMGGVAAGKTTVRAQRYSKGYVVIDSAEMFHHLSRGDSTLNFPDAFKDLLELLGARVTRRALSERRNIVTEIIGANEEPVKELITSLRALGYKVEVVAITCDIQESLRRSEMRGDNISAFYAEHFQRRWILDACRELIKESDKHGVDAMFSSPEAMREARQVNRDESPRAPSTRSSRRGMQAFTHSLVKLATSSPGWFIFAVFYALVYVGALWETVAAIDDYFRWYVIDEPKILHDAFRDMGYKERYALGVLLLVVMTTGLVGAVRIFENRTRDGAVDKNVG